MTIKKMPVIGFLTISTNEPNVWRGVKDAALEAGAAFLCISGESLKIPYGYDWQLNNVYKIINEGIVDGLVVWSHALGAYIPRAELELFLKSLPAIPMVEYGGDILKNSLQVSADSQSELMKRVLMHLKEVHGVKKVAFVRGPAKLNDTCTDFITAARETGIETDMKLVTPPDLRKVETGRKAASILLDERKLVPGRDFQAIFVPEDIIAHGILDEFKKRGINIPGDVLLAGGSDREENSYSSPTITSLYHYPYESAKAACQLLLSIMNKEKSINRNIQIPSKIILRESCGCVSSSDFPLSGLKNSESINNAHDGNRTVTNSINSEYIKQLDFHKRFLRLCSELPWAGNFQELVRLLDSGIYELGLDSLEIFLYDNYKNLPALLVGGRVKVYSGCSFSQNHIDKGSLCGSIKAHTVETLYTRNELLGYASIDCSNSSGNIYRALFSQISSIVRNFPIVGKRKHIAYLNNELFLTVSHESRAKYRIDLLVNKLEENSPEQPSSKIVCSAARFIRNNYNRNITDADISSHVGKSQRHIRRCFKLILDMTPQELLNELRIEIAKELLTKGLNVTETALEVGFSSIPYFSKVFKAKTGFTPKNFKHCNS